MRRVIEPKEVVAGGAGSRGSGRLDAPRDAGDARDAGPFIELRPFLKDGGLRLGTWGYEILGELDVRQEDWYVEKSRLSAFFQTNLELVLRALDAETVLLGGVLTNQCVGATCKDACSATSSPSSSRSAPVRRCPTCTGRRSR